MSEIVECLSDHDYTGRPVAITWQEQRLEIATILERWNIPNARCFRVKTTDEKIFDLTYAEFEDEWSIHQHEEDPCRKKVK